MTNDTTLYQSAPKGSQNEEAVVETAQHVDNKKNAGGWKQTGAGTAAGAAAGAASAWATQAGAADPQPAPQPQPAPKKEEPQAEPKQEPKPEPQTEPKQELQPDTQKDSETGSQQPTQQEQQDSQQATDQNVRVVSDSEIDNFELEGVRIVGASEIEGHLAVAYDVNSDEDPDVAIVDVDDSGDISAPDVVFDGEGNAATVGEIYEAQMQQEDNTDPANQSLTEDPSLAQNPDVAPDMPDYMNDAVMDA